VVRKPIFNALALTLFVFVLCGCNPETPTPPADKNVALAAANEPPNAQGTTAQKPPSGEGITEISAAAQRSEGLFAAEEAERTLPADHWLRQTPIQKDTVPATIAPPEPRVLLKQHGPAYLEQIGETRVLHLKGSYYDMGYQHGALLKEEIRLGATLIRTVGRVAWKKDFVKSSREAWERSSAHIPQKYKEELEGMAEALGMPVEEVQEFNIFPELFHCSGFAFWGNATADGALLHGRVLDYMREIGMDQWAIIIVQEPENAHAFVNVGYAGLIGSVTGMNVQHVALGEMGGGGAEKWDGMPMTFLMRECLEMGTTLEDACRIMRENPRTCEYYYVISDAKAQGGRGDAVGVASTPDDIQFIGPNEFHKLLPRPVEDAVLLSAGGRYQCLADRVEAMHGKITPQIALDIMARGVSMRSNLHNALFKPATLELWVANSTLLAPSCNRPYVHYDLNVLLNEQPAS